MACARPTRCLRAAWVNLNSMPQLLHTTYVLCNTTIRPLRFEVMKVSEEEARRLLAEVRKASGSMERARSRRDQAIREAMSAGVARQEIADAAGLERTQLYRITGTKPQQS